MDFALTSAFSPSRSPFALNFEARKHSITTNYKNIPYVSVSMPIITARRKDGDTMLCAGSASIIKPLSSFYEFRGDYVLDDFMDKLDYAPSFSTSISGSGHFYTYNPVDVKKALAAIELLTAAWDAPGYLPEDYVGWFVKA